MNKHLQGELKMNRNKTKLTLALLFLAQPLLIDTTHAQVSKEMKETSDYVEGILDRVTKQDQFNSSNDFSVAGPELQAREQESLREFKKSMDMMFTGLANAVDQYNAVYRDQSISPQSRAAQLNSLYSSLSVQAQAAEASYQAALFKLFAVEPSWLILSSKIYSKSIVLEFADGSTKRIKNKNLWDFEDSNPEIQSRILSILQAACSTRACFANLHASYASYFADVDNLLNRDIPVKLADPSKNLSIHSLKALKSSFYTQISTAITTFDFKKAYFLDLPQSN